MSNTRLFLPAISREVAFISAHSDDADAVYERELDVDDSTHSLVKRVYDQANQDVLDLLWAATDAVSAALKDIVRINWAKRRDPWRWTRAGPIALARGRWRPIGWAGLSVAYGSQPVRLVSWVSPRGGLDARKELTEFCSGKLDVSLVSDAPGKWPDWDDRVVYDVCTLKLTTDRAQVLRQAGAAAKRFFKVAKLKLDDISKR